MHHINDAGEPATQFQETVLETAEWCYLQHQKITAQDIAERYNVTIPTARKRMQAISYHKDTIVTATSKPYAIQVRDVKDKYTHLNFTFFMRVTSRSQVQYA